MAALSNIEITQERRLCTVSEKLGYFHCWEHYSRPIEASPLRGGAPAGVISFVRAIVEFPDGVKYVAPDSIKFCDEENKVLNCMAKHQDESKEE